MELRVWAPDAARVTVSAADTLTPLSAGMGGWWTGPDLAPGTDYTLSVDGNGPFPDPRSGWQPHGVHGPSRVFDSTAYSWGDDGWAGLDVRGAVHYELHVGTFTIQGTLDAAAGRLADLAKLGIEVVELMPVAPFPGQHGWGYDGVSLFAVHEPYGGPAALQRFVDAAHRAGMAVCLDVVYNHLGPSGNYLAPFGPYFTDAHHTPWGEAVNLDQDGCHEVRRYFIDNAKRWFTEFHVDALRLDAVHELKDDSEKHFLAELADEVAALSSRLGRPLSLTAESDLNDATMVAATASGGRGMTAQWNDDVHHALHAYLTGERHGYYVDFGDIDTLDHVFRNVFFHDGRFSTFRDRDWGAPVGGDVDRRRFVVCAANHDQVGNRALGDRPASTLSPGGQAASLALTLLGPFTPLLFMGEEYGEDRPFMFFADHQEPELAEAVTAGRLREFSGHGWEEVYGGEVVVPDPQDPMTFRRSKLGDGVAAAGGVHDQLRAWLAALMAARPLTMEEGAWRQSPVSVSELADRVLVMAGPVEVIANLSDAEITVERKAPLAVFGSVFVEGDATTLAADSVVLVVPSEKEDS